MTVGKRRRFEIGFWKWKGRYGTGWQGVRHLVAQVKFTLPPLSAATIKTIPVALSVV